jgi:hypothetical protein
MERWCSADRLDAADCYFAAAFKKWWVFALSVAIYGPCGCRFTTRWNDLGKSARRVDDDAIAGEKEMEMETVMEGRSQSY